MWRRDNSIRLPNCEEAFVPEEKVKDYLLSRTHPVGKWKARFFRSWGFDEPDAEALIQQLRAIACSGEVEDVVASQYGTKYVVVGRIATQTASVLLKTVWIVESGQDFARFVTAYPAQ